MDGFKRQDAMKSGDEYINSTEVFSGNKSINSALHRILSKLSARSANAVCRVLREKSSALQRHMDGHQGDEQALHVYRELLVGEWCIDNEYRVEYGAKIDEKTPDWSSESDKLIVEVVSHEPNEEVRKLVDENLGKGSPVVFWGDSKKTQDRLGRSLKKKVDVYKSIVTKHRYAYVVAIYSSFLANAEVTDIEAAITNAAAFDSPHLSGVMFCEGSDGAGYQVRYFANPTASIKAFDRL